jgi:hypothetical protein
MRFVAVNGSPRAGRGVTGGILRVFVEGLLEGGGRPAGDPSVSPAADPSAFIRCLRDMTVKPCLGDWACWVRSPGRCSQDDDMNDLYPLIREADVMVLATPVYVDGMTGPMKTFVDRLIAILDPMIDLRDGHSRHPLVPGQKVDSAQIVLVSACGFHEADNFEPLVQHVKAICRNLGRRYGGALLRPHGPVLGPLLNRVEAKDGGATKEERGAGGGRPVLPPEAYAAALDVAAAVREVGRGLAQTGRLDEEILRRISQPLLDRDLYNQWINAGVRPALPLC